MLKETKKDGQQNKKDREITRREDRPIRDVFNRFFNEDFWQDPLDFWRDPARTLSEIRKNMFPQIDISETDREIKVVANVPGVNPDDIDLDIHDDRMVIRGSTERKTESEPGERPYRYERSYGEFRREFQLPAQVNENSVKAVCKDGVLTVTMPKIETEKKSKIRIEKQ